MYRTVLRTASRPATSCLRAQTLRAGPRRFASTTSPADKSRTWKGSAFRWGLAAAAVYYYNTSTVFMDDGATAQRFTAPPSAFPETDKNLPTVDSVVEERKKQAAAKAETPVKTEKKEDGAPSAQAEEAKGNETQAAAGSPEALEEEAGQEGAFNPETGEINWDCPCLGGMAHGPCGEQFKTAFSCFVYSTEEPKGMDCIEKFQGMQECFRQYPEIYGGELEDDEADDESADATVGAPKEQQPQQEKQQEQQEQQQQKADEDKGPGPTGDAEVNTPESVKAHEVEGEPAPSPAPENPLVAKSQSSGPKWEDATAANGEVEGADKGKGDEKKKD